MRILAISVPRTDRVPYKVIKVSFSGSPDVLERLRKCKTYILFQPHMNRYDGHQTRNYLHTLDGSRIFANVR